MPPAFSLRFPFAVSLVCLSLASLREARGAVSYAIAGSTYLENFDGLPKNAPNNASIETGATAYPNGWTDDTTTITGDRVSVPGWYLYHPILQTAEGGTNDHQRLRFGSGSSTTGSFYAFGTTNSAADMALGDLGSNTMATLATDPNPTPDLFLAVRLVNDTGMTLTSFTLTYDGEQWRRGDSVGLEVLEFEYSTTAVAGDWNSTATYTAVPALDFTPPVTGAVGAVNGNVAGLDADISATVTGISWAPGTELWLRWSDENVPGADDGLAIDNVRFSAIPEPASGLLGLGAVAVLGIRRRRR